MQNISNIIESLLFVAEEPLTVEKIKNILETVDTKEVRSALHVLVDRYEARGGGFRLCEVAGGWQLRSRPEYHEWIKRMLQPSPQRLSKAAIETLAIVAYNQPIIRADIEHIRGVDSGGVLRQLMERKLVRVLGRKEIPGRPMIYATTKLFLELFDLKDLKDLPTPKEMEELGAAVDNDPDSPQQAVQETRVEAPNESTPPPSDELAFTSSDFGIEKKYPVETTAPTLETPTDQNLETPPKAIQVPRKSFMAPHKISTTPFSISAKPHKISASPHKISVPKKP